MLSPRETTALSADEVRRITLYAQGFLGAGAKRGGVTGVVRRVSAVQLDTISVLARSHELVAYARLGPVGRDAVEQAYWPDAKADDVRVLGARGLHLADRGLAVLRLAAAGHRRPRAALAQGLRGRLRAGARPAARRGAADRDPARRREGGRAVVGLVGGEDRRRVAARHRPGGLRAAHRLAARLRPAGAGHPEGPDRPRADRRGVPVLPGRDGRQGARRGDPRGLHRVPAAQRVRAAHARTARRSTRPRRRPGSSP